MADESSGLGVAASGDAPTTAPSSPFRRRVSLGGGKSHNDDPNEQGAKKSQGTAHLVDATSTTSTGYMEQLAGSWGTAISAHARKGLDGLGSMAAESDYVPDFIKDMIPKPASESSLDPLHEKDTVLWTKLDIDPADGATIALVGYSDGFQMWKLDKRGRRAQEVVCVRDKDTCVRSVRLLQTPHGEGECPLDSARPLLAVSSARDAENFPRCCVKVFSIPLNQYAHVLRFKSPVLGIRSNARQVVVAVANAIYSFSARTLDHAFSVASYPCPTTAVDGVLALGDAWLAYPSGDPNLGKSSSSDSNSNASNTNASSTDGMLSLDDAYSVSALAKDFSTGLYYLGSLGKSTIDSYLQPSLPQNASASAPSNSAATTRSGNAIRKSAQLSPGFVVVRNSVTRHVIARFRSQKSPIAMLKFDPSGTLLATACTTGQTIHVHRIIPQGATSQCSGSSHELLYRLDRGLSHAVIRDVSFSADMHWTSVSSAHGTTHLFPITPLGGPVSPATHKTLFDETIEGEGSGSELGIYSSSPTISETLAWSLKQSGKGATTLQPLVRIRATVGPTAASEDALRGSVDPNLPVPISALMRGASLFTIASEAKLVEHLLVPVASDSELRVNANASRCWDVCRRGSWDDVNTVSDPSLTSAAPARVPSSPSRLAQTMRRTSQETDWMAQVEIATHKANPIPLWSLPQFQFRAFASVECASEASGGPLFIETAGTEEVEIGGCGTAPAVVHSHDDASGDGNRPKNIVTSLIKSAMGTPTAFRAVSL